MTVLKFPERDGGIYHVNVRMPEVNDRLPMDEWSASFCAPASETDLPALARATLISVLAVYRTSGYDHAPFSMADPVFLKTVRHLLDMPIHESCVTLCDCKPHGACIGLPDPNYRGPKVEDCEAIGNQHEWYNIDDISSACYHCKVRRKGQLWR